jgi:hypothetical protein
VVQTPTTDPTKILIFRESRFTDERINRNANLQKRRYIVATESRFGTATQKVEPDLPSDVTQARP